MGSAGERYEGTEPYIFISYSHRDSELIYAFVAAMAERGYRVWYDANIQAGKQWTAELAEKIAACEIFLPFISQSFAASEYCMQEVRHAKSEKRNIVPVKLDLPRKDYTQELKFLLENGQGFSMDSFPTPGAFAARLDAEPLFQKCRARAPDEPEANPVPAPFAAGNSETASPATENGRPDYNSKAGGVEIITVDEMNPARRLANATFEISKKNGGLLRKVTTGNDGRVSASLEAGDYELVEFEASDGYEVNPAPTPFTVRDGEVISLTIRNRRFDYNHESEGVEIIKVDDADEARRLSNVAFEIRRQDGGLVRKVHTRDDGRVDVSLGAGYYTLVEVKAADGYKVNPAPRYFTVRKGEVTTLTVPNKRSNPFARFMKYIVALLLFLAAVAGVAVYRFTRGGASSTDSGGARYMDTEVSIYVGGGSTFANSAALNSPDYMDEEDGVLYVWDSGSVRELRPMREDSYEIRDYPPADALHVHKGDVYLLTAPWAEPSPYSGGEADSRSTDYKFTILRVRGGDETYENVAEGDIPSNITDMVGEPFYAGEDMLSMRFTDFALSGNGSTLWLVRQDAGIGAGNVSLERILYDVDADRFPSDGLEWFADLQWNVTDDNRPRLALDDNDNLYVSFPEDHCVAWFNFEGRERSFEILAGNEKDGGYRDGHTPAFIKPTSIAVKGDYLYVYDSGAVRRVSLTDGACVTMAGRAIRDGENPLPSPEMPMEKVSGQEAVFPCGEYPGLAVRDDGRVLLCDNVRGVIYQIAERTVS